MVGDSEICIKQGNQNKIRVDDEETKNIKGMTWQRVWKYAMKRKINVDRKMRRCIEIVICTLTEPSFSTLQDFCRY